MSIQTVTQETMTQTLKLKQPSGDPTNGSYSLETTDEIDNAKKVSNRDFEKLEWWKTQPPNAEEIKNSNIPCLSQESQGNQVNMDESYNKRNKNDKPGSLAQSEDLIEEVVILTSQISVLDIDGPEVDLPPPVPPGSRPAYSYPEPGPVASVSTASLGSAASSLELSASSSNDKLEYGDLSASSMPSNSSLSDLRAKPANEKSDFIIIHTEEDEDEAYEFKNHLERDIGIPDIKVQLIGSFGYGQSELGCLHSLPDHFNHILVYATENLCKCSYTKFMNEIIIKCNLRIGQNCRMTPVWTTKMQQPIPELSILPGLPYWRFLTKNLPNFYIEKVKILVKQVR